MRWVRRGPAGRLGLRTPQDDPSDALKVAEATANRAAGMARAALIVAAMALAIAVLGLALPIR